MFSLLCLKPWSDSSSSPLSVAWQFSSTSCSTHFLSHCISCHFTLPSSWPVTALSLCISSSSPFCLANLKCILGPVLVLASLWCLSRFPQTHTSSHCTTYLLSFKASLHSFDYLNLQTRWQHHLTPFYILKACHSAWHTACFIFVEWDEHVKVPRMVTGRNLNVRRCLLNYSSCLWTYIVHCIPQFMFISLTGIKYKSLGKLFKTLYIIFPAIFLVCLLPLTFFQIMFPNPTRFC